MDSNTVMQDFFVGLSTNFLAAFLGFLLAYLARDRLFNPYRYGGSRVRVVRRGEELTSRDISWRKAQEVADDISELSVFLKGVISPYAWVTCDIVAEGLEVGLLTIEKKRKFLLGESRVYTIHVDKNPKPDKSRFEGWRVRVSKNGRERVNRPISPAKVENILSDPDNLAAFARDVASPFGRITCDLVDEGRAIGLLAVDAEGRVIAVDLDKNPVPEEARP